MPGIAISHLRTVITYCHFKPNSFVFVLSPKLDVYMLRKSIISTWNIYRLVIPNVDLGVLACNNGFSFSSYKYPLLDV